MQAGASRKFKPDPETGEIYKVIDTTNRLRKEPEFADVIPPIRIFRYGEGVYTLDHRRLVAHRLDDVPIRYRLATSQEVAKELGQKLDTESGDGLSIRIRIQEGGEK